MKRLNKIISIILISLLLLSPGTACSKKGELPDERNSDPVSSGESKSSEESKTDESRGEGSESQGDSSSEGFSEDPSENPATVSDSEDPAPTEGQESKDSGMTPGPTSKPTPTTAPKPTDKPTPTPDPNRISAVSILGTPGWYGILEAKIEPASAKIKSYQWMISGKADGPYHNLEWNTEAILFYDLDLLGSIFEMEDDGLLDYNDDYKLFFKVSVTDTGGKTVLSDYVQEVYDYPMELVVSEGGSIVANGVKYDKQGIYIIRFSEGDKVTLTAEADKGRSFGKWKVEVAFGQHDQSIQGFNQNKASNTFTIHEGMSMFSFEAVFE